MSKIKIGIASYTKEQWQLLKERAVDRKKLDSTYADWEKKRDQTIAMLRGKSYEPVLVPMVLAEVEAWCKARMQLNTSENRTLICTEKLRKMDGKPSGGG